MSGPMATFSDSRGGGSFLGTRPPWEESSGRFSSPDQSPNFGMSPEFSQGSTRPPIFYQGSDSFRPSESYFSGRGQHPPGFWVPPEGGSAENIALDCKVQEPRCFPQLVGRSFMGSWSAFWFGRSVGAAESCSWVILMGPPRQVPTGVAERHWQMSASACIRGCHGLWPWWLSDGCALPFSPGSLRGFQKEVSPLREVGISSLKVWCERSPTHELASWDRSRQLHDQSRGKTTWYTGGGRFRPSGMWRSSQHCDGLGWEGAPEGVAELCSRLRTEAARVVAVGEIGIDTLVVKSTAQLDRQVAFLTALVKALMESSDLKHLPLVLHVREGDDTRRASSTCITILKDAGVPQNHKVYRHSFLGDYQEAQDWLRAFPNVMFGVCPLSLLRPAVKPVLVKVAWDRLLVEADAPYQRKAIHDGPRPSIHVTSPFHIALVYRWLACVKQAATVGEAARRISANFSHFFDCVVLHKKNWGSSCGL